MKGLTMKLRNMSAYVTEEKNITIVLASGEVLNLENALVLHSQCAIKAVNNCFPRFHTLFYSVQCVNALPDGNLTQQLPFLVRFFQGFSQLFILPIHVTDIIRGVSSFSSK